MGDYSGIETFAMWFGGIFWGGIFLAMVAGWVGLYLEWKDVKKKAYKKRSEVSDSYRIERNEVLSIIRERIEGDVYLLPDKEQGDWDSVKDSSEVASLFRYAHFAGCHITFEQNEGNWEDDPEYLDANVFKTDLKDAATKRKDKELFQYRRYFEPPMSKRERALKNIS